MPSPTQFTFSDTLLQFASPPQKTRDAARKHNPPVGALDHHTVVRVGAPNQRRSRAQAARPEKLERTTVLSGFLVNAGNDEPGVDRRSNEQLFIGMHVAASGNGVPIWAGRRLSGKRFNPRLHNRREDRFEVFRLTIHFVPGHFERIAEENVRAGGDGE